MRDPLRWDRQVMRALAAYVLIAGCYAPNAQPGSPCGANGACPEPLTCSPVTSTCERSAAAVDARRDDALVPGDGCVPTAEVCGDGVDQDCNGIDPACAANDGPAGAIDVTAGGMFTEDAAFAHDDVGANGCGADGGRDVFYSISLADPRVYYFDTFGSSFDTIIRVYARACTDVGTGDNALTCVDDSCATAQGQLAVSLPAGDSCIVIDQASDAEVSGDVALEVVAGVRNGVPLPSGMQTLTGDTTGASNTMEPSNNNCDGPGSNGRDLAYFFTRCPNQDLLLDAATCNAATWDTVLYVRRGNTTQVACNDDDCDGLRSRLTNAAITGGDFFWLVIDGFDPSHFGPYTLTTNLR